MSIITKGILKISIFSILLMSAYFLTEETRVVGRYIHPSMPWIIAFYWVQSSIIHALVNFAKNTLETDFSIILIGGFTLRLITALMVVIIVVFVGMENHEMYIINFFAVYLFYLVFEIVTVLSNLRTNLK
jgi:hypothetical protein